ncbi:hypothetical protein [Nocardia transvalensis]|uniref:hypothetical protein n=1 Tax=Nocardia transvalensis TaxID=37333 RepID=UPI001894F2C5|nr:hypothetical protein [Nocardia transvalensis]MBF6333309.1 hypothetical protein [Nocardia transvalensis]
MTDNARHGAQRILELMDTDKDAAMQFNAKALVAASEMQARWVSSALDDPDNPLNDLAITSGKIQGLVDYGLTLESDDRTKDAIHGATMDSLTKAPPTTPSRLYSPRASSTFRYSAMSLGLSAAVGSR